MNLINKNCYIYINVRITLTKKFFGLLLINPSSITAGELTILWTLSCACGGPPNRMVERARQGCHRPPGCQISGASEQPSAVGCDVGDVPSPNIERTD